MTKVAVISDIHGDVNSFARFSKNVKDKVDMIFCLGDITGDMGSAKPEAIIDVLDFWNRHNDRPETHVVFGNHDARWREHTRYAHAKPEWVPGGDGDAEVVANHYRKMERNYLLDLPERIEQGAFVAAHANPYAPNGNFCGYPGENYLHKDDYLTFTEDLNYRIMLIGHTHKQAQLDLDKFEGRSGLVVNPGSLCDETEYMQGKPPQYALIDTETRLVTFITLEGRSQ